MRARWADPPAGLPVLPGRRGAAHWPGCRWRGAGEAGEGANRSAHSGHRPRAQTQPLAAETHRWERVNVTVSLPSRGWPESWENEAEELEQLMVYFLCLMGGYLSKPSHPITVPLSLYHTRSCSHTYTHPRTHSGRFGERLYKQWSVGKSQFATVRE